MTVMCVCHVAPLSVENDPQHARPQLRGKPAVCDVETTGRPATTTPLFKPPPPPPRARLRMRCNWRRRGSGRRTGPTPNVELSPIPFVRGRRWRQGPSGRTRRTGARQCKWMSRKRRGGRASVPHVRVLWH